MLHFDFKRNSKKCSKTDRVLQPGEEFYSALVESGDATERLDFSVEAWESPPENCLGWWKSKIPDLSHGKIYWAPKHVMLAYFEHVSQQPDQADVAYITGLLLAQRKILTIEESFDEPDGPMLQLRNRHDKETYSLPVVECTPQRLAEIQAELSERLFTDQPFGTDEDVAEVDSETDEP